MRAEDVAGYFSEWDSISWASELCSYRVPLPETARYPAVHRGGARINDEPVYCPPFLLAQAFGDGARRPWTSDVDQDAFYGAGLRLALVQGNGRFLRMEHGEGRSDYEHAIHIPAEWALPFVDALVRMRPKLEEVFGAIP